MLHREFADFRTSNQHEIHVAEQLKAQGYTVIRRGWPDFIVLKGNEVRFIEVKPRKSHPNGTPCQMRVARILKSLGIVVEIVNGDMDSIRPMI